MIFMLYHRGSGTICMPFSDHAFDLRKRSRCFFDECPYCHHNHIKKYGKEHGHHRWMCRDCGKTFSDRTGTVLSSAKLRPSQIRRLVSMLLDGTALRQAAHQAHVPLKTALLWKRKMQRMPEGKEETRTPKKTPAGRRRNRLPGRSPAAARKPGGLQGQAIQWMPSLAISPLAQSSTMTWDTSVAASPDAPQERSAMAVGECVLEGAGKGSVLRHIQVPLLQRYLPFRKALRRWNVYQHEQQLCLSFFKE